MASSLSESLSPKKTLFPWSCPLLSLLPFGESLLEYNREIFWTQIPRFKYYKDEKKDYARKKRNVMYETTCQKNLRIFF